MVPYGPSNNEKWSLIRIYEIVMVHRWWIKMIKSNIILWSILLIVQYKYSKSCSGDFNSPESDPPHKIMRYWFYYSIWMGFSFSTDHAGLVEMICTTDVPLSKGHLGGPALKYFYMIHRGGRLRDLVPLEGISFRDV